MAKLPRTIKRLRDPRDLWLFLQILTMLLLLPRRIRKSSLPDMLASIDPGITPRRRDRALLDKTVGFTDSLLRYRVFQRYGKCLLRSLVLFRVLRRQGWPVEIHFGVRKTEERANDITGHSWLMLDGEPFLEDACHASSYSTTFRYK